MATHGDGWLYLTDGVDTWRLLVEDWDYGVIAEPEIDQLPGDSRVGFDLEYRKRTVKAKNVHFESLAGADGINAFLKDMDDWNAAGAFSLKIRAKTTDYLDFGAAGDDIDVFYKSITSVHKPGRGEVEHFVIKLITFKEG